MRGQSLLRHLIGQILAEYTASALEIPDLYLRFAEQLRPSDYVLTFNYDVLLERALQAVGKSYRLFPTRYTSADRGSAIVARSWDEVVILKFHGSIDWFDKAQYSEWEEAYRRAGSNDRPTHPVFGESGDNLTLRKLIDGPRMHNDPLDEVYRVLDIESLYQRRWMFLATPWLLAPSTMKIVYASNLVDFWHGLGSAGVLNFGLAIVGYSLPPEDDYARQAVYSVVTNYQTEYWGKEVFERIKTPLVIVDFRQTEEDIRTFKERYRFVDWERATPYFGGFDETSLWPAVSRHIHFRF